jgi:hypothetical protein
MIKTRSSTSRTRLLCKDSIPNFLKLLKNETWGVFYELHDVQDTFNSFLNTFLITFESCFPAQHIIQKQLVIGLLLA